MERSNIYLIGYRCTGKSTVGRKMADRLDLGFADTDALITAKEKRSIARIVADQGWPYFRNLEKNCLAQLAARPDTVVATGGGIILHPDNIARMQVSGQIVWLQASPGTIMNRLAQDPATAASRPALTQQAVPEEIRATLAERTGYYHRAADWSLPTDTASPDELVTQIRERLARDHRC